MSPPRVIIIGGGSRGHAYGKAITSFTDGIVAAVAEPVPFKRAEFGTSFIWGSNEPSEGQDFSHWKEFLEYETKRRARVAAGEASVPPGVDAAFICVLDEMHREVIVGLAPLGLHIMCEKPLATTLDDCLDMYDALNKSGSLFSIGHVLRYSPHNILLRKLLLSDRVIGDIVSVEHTEPVGWWHFAHSYVRGNWRRESTTAPSLLTKSCHDVDLLLWLLSAPFKSGTGEFHLPSKVTSTGSLHGYRKSRKPAAAGNATNCMSCPLGDSGCKYSAKNIYLGSKLAGLGANNRGWPTKIVAPEIEDAPMELAVQMMTAKLREDYSEHTPDAQVAARPWFGRCVFESDNDVCDDQFVTFTWDDEPSVTEPGKTKFSKQATLHMAASTKKICDRYSYIYGTEGQIHADSTTITVEDFNTGETTTHVPSVEDSHHGGGDLGLSRQFIAAVDKVKNEGWDVEKAQNEFMGCSLEEAVRSHAVVFAAEEARTEGKVIDWKAWWSRVEQARKGTNGHTNGHANGHPNGYTNGRTNGHA
ncbi:streptomycin biosynthesis protein StrI [Plectosphaerella cucumerina]|uniref:Streptomycin biosynthesis protein StrI n=1 Tax=Plectosphaerella cucumerina TaxID=40658 RepID=A0A8K0TRA7_9PEZI|nr:streptomycin biosynthesis protein StrI [Plectosphaerella cucumerina]